MHIELEKQVMSLAKLATTIADGTAKLLETSISHERRLARLEDSQ